nr:hypothetical protein [Tanacetum cinerariifolium]
MITTYSKMEGMKPSRLIETMDIMDLIPSIGNVHSITQDHALSGVRIATNALAPQTFAEWPLNYDGPNDDTVLYNNSIKNDI